ncbi:MAG: hypothetical protein ACYC67_13085 [Prosthecobacter sp.]
MSALTNTKAEACAQLLAKGGISEHAAYAQAFGVSKRSAEGNASAQMEKHGIRARVAELQAQGAETLSLSHAAWLESFVRLAKKAEEAGEYAAARSNLREIGLAQPGWYAKDGSKESADTDLATHMRELVSRMRV